MNSLIVRSAAMLVLMWGACVHGEVYKTTNPDGTITYTDSPTSKSEKVKIYPSKDANARQGSPKVAGATSVPSDENGMPSANDVKPIQEQPSTSAKAASRAASSTSTAAGGGSSSGGGSSGKAGGGGSTASGKAATTTPTTKAPAAAVAATTVKVQPAPGSTTASSSSDASASLGEAPTISSDLVCNVPTSSQIAVNIDTSKVVRSHVPGNVFGFTIDWYMFQNAYFRMGKVRPEVVEWMKPFKGAMYRYSGGNTFLWPNAVGPITARKTIWANFFWKYPEFGPSEFFDFIDEVDGKAVVLLNVVGENKWDSAAIAKENLAYIDWLKKNRPGCVSGENCRIHSFELGNETDWEAHIEWSPEYYIEQLTPLIKQAKAQFPDIKLAVVGKTAPWDKARANYDETVAPKLAKSVDEVTIHPYYDGMHIPAIKIYIDKLAKIYQGYNPNAKVLVTEHGFWPSAALDSVDSMIQASGSGGALSSADFSLMAMLNENISGNMWHTFSAESPWQLFHRNYKTDTLYPSAVYWSMRTLREGFLDDAVEVSPSLLPGNAYIGGYDGRVVAMKNSLGALSLMGVNRANQSKVLRITPGKESYNNGLVRVNVTPVGLSKNYNSATDPININMKQYETRYSSGVPLQLCIPPRSVFSIVINK